MTQTILVTGASGTIGRELVQQLHAAGAAVIAGSSSGRHAHGVATRRVDFTDIDSLRTAFAGIHTLFLLLPLTENKLAMARNAIQAAREAGVQHIVRSSGAGADATSPFALARLQGEIDELVQNSGIAWTLLRPNCFMQNFIHFHGEQIRSGTVYLPQGEGLISHVDARDIAAVASRILQQPAAHAGAIYTLTGAQALDNASALAIIARHTGRSLQYVSVSDADGVAAMRSLGMSEWLVGQLLSLHQIIRAGYAAGVSSTVADLLGRAPLSFEQFVQDHRAAWD